MKALPVLNAKAAGIDVGSETLHLSIEGGSPRVFGTTTRDLEQRWRPRGCTAYVRLSMVGNFTCSRIAAIGVCAGCGHTALARLHEVAS